MKLDYSKITVDEMDINTADYPDFCDSFIISASWEDGTPLNDAELDELNDDADFVYNEICKRVF
jgi:hypothetical protein